MTPLWLWSAAHREYRLASNPDTRLRDAAGKRVFVVSVRAGAALLSADELTEAAAIARRYAETGVWGEGDAE